MKSMCQSRVPYLLSPHELLHFPSQHLHLLFPHLLQQSQFFLLLPYPPNQPLIMPPITLPLLQQTPLLTQQCLLLPLVLLDLPQDGQAKALGLFFEWPSLQPSQRDTPLSYSPPLSSLSSISLQEMRHPFIQRRMGGGLQRVHPKQPLSQSHQRAAQLSRNDSLGKRFEKRRSVDGCSRLQEGLRVGWRLRGMRRRWSAVLRGIRWTLPASQLEIGSMGALCGSERPCLFCLLRMEVQSHLTTLGIPRAKPAAGVLSPLPGEIFVRGTSFNHLQWQQNYNPKQPFFEKKNKTKIQEASRKYLSSMIIQRQ